MRQIETQRPDLTDVSGDRRLHIGGSEAREGWEVLDIQQAAHVDHRGDVRDLSGFADASYDVVYASHVLEHLGYQQDLPRALAGIARILRPGGKLLASVPDLDVLCRLFVHPQATREQRFHIMRIMFGGQTDPYDFHYVGLKDEFLAGYLYRAGFREVFRVSEFKLFDDSSALRFGDVLISLNMVAIR